MESAELERTTVDIAAKVGARTHRAARHRHGGQVRRLPHALSGRTRTTRPTTRSANRLPQMSAGESAGQARDRRDPAFHRAAAALFGSLAGQAHGRARHRPALDLRLDPAGAAGTADMCGSTRSGSYPRTRAASSSRSWKASSPATSNTTSPPSLEEQLDRISNNEIAWRDVLRDFWRDFIGAVDDIKDLRIAAGARRARRDAGAASVPAAARTAAIRASARAAATAGCR